MVALNYRERIGLHDNVIIGRQDGGPENGQQLAMNLRKSYANDVPFGYFTGGGVLQIDELVRGNLTTSGI